MSAQCPSTMLSTFWTRS